LPSTGGERICWGDSVDHNSLCQFGKTARLNDHAGVRADQRDAQYRLNHDMTLFIAERQLTE
jgi:hypothetical protein